MNHWESCIAYFIVGSPKNTVLCIYTCLTKVCFSALILVFLLLVVISLLFFFSLSRTCTPNLYDGGEDNLLINRETQDVCVCVFHNFVWWEKLGEPRGNHRSRTSIWNETHLPSVGYHCIYITYSILANG